jgi:hypothetical protein
MRSRKVLTLVFGAVAVTLCCASGISAQISSELTRCLPYPTLADEIQDLRDEVKAKSGAPILPEKIVVDEVIFDAPPGLSKSLRERIRLALMQYQIKPDDGGWLEQLQDEVVRSQLMDDGFFEVRPSVTSEVIRTDSAGQHVSLQVHIDETSQYTLGEVTFRSGEPDVPLVFPAEELRDLLPLHEGDVLAAYKIRAGIQAMGSLYGSRGYVDLVATPLTNIDETRKRVGLIFELDQQPQFRIAQIEIFGLDSATEKKLKSQLVVGQVFNILLVDEFFKTNQAILPPGASRENLELRRDLKTDTVEVRFDFRSHCPSAVR